MNCFPSRNLWRAEALRLRRQPVAWISLGALLLMLLATSIDAGMAARAWRVDAAQDARLHAERLQRAVAQVAAAPEGAARAIATYQVGRSDLGATRLPVAEGLALGVRRLDTLPVQLKVSLDSRQVDARDPGPLRNPLLTDGGLPGVPAMVALLLPLVALLLCGGLLQEEREQGRLPLLQVQSLRGLSPLLAAALAWRWLAVWAVTAVATLPALALDPAANAATAAVWVAALAAFTAFWVAVGGLLSRAPVSGGTSLLVSLGLWLALTFAVPGALARLAQQAAPMPSRLGFIVTMRAAQQHAEDHEEALARAWYARHPGTEVTWPAVWPASFVPRTLNQDEALRPALQSFDRSRANQAAFMARWSWASPGLALVMLGERLAGTDAVNHRRYLQAVDAFEARWRDVLVPKVMDRRGIDPESLRHALSPGFGSGIGTPPGDDASLPVAR